MFERANVWYLWSNDEGVLSKLVIQNGFTCGITKNKVSN